MATQLVGERKGTTLHGSLSGLSFVVCGAFLLGYCVLAKAQDDMPPDAPEVPQDQPRFLVSPELVESQLSEAAAFDPQAMSLDNGGPAVCEAVLTHAANVYAREFSLDDKKSWVYAKKCGSSSGSSSAGIDLLVGKLPVGFSGSRQEQAKWCNENERYSRRTQGYERIENQVMATAIQNWSQCIEAYASNLIIRVSPSLDDNVFQFRIKNGTNNRQKLTSLSVISNEGRGVTCDTSIPPDIEIRPAEYHSFVCQRTYVEVERLGEPYKVLPGGSISIGNPLSPYLYSFEERYKDGLIPEPDIVKTVFRLDGQHIATKGYWGGGAAHAMLYCGGVIPNDKPRPGFDLIDMGKREVRVAGRGLCGRAPHCDSHNEFCQEVFWVKGCYINKVWHDWYKDKIAQSNIAYSKEAVCAVQ
ncbi:hypothetical protein [Lentisalinibacter orientalis]|uniref:hypothetical protein n=1 Tax=Lentisalinibacter orientalis TaxID=2992241 RepID=UPI00386D9B69